MHELGGENKNVLGYCGSLGLSLRGHRWTFRHHSTATPYSRNSRAPISLKLLNVTRPSQDIMTRPRREKSQRQGRRWGDDVRSSDDDQQNKPALGFLTTTTTSRAPHADQTGMGSQNSLVRLPALQPSSGYLSRNRSSWRLSIQMTPRRQMARSNRSMSHPLLCPIGRSRPSGAPLTTGKAENQGEICR